MSDERFKPPTVFKKRFARRERTARPFTFVRDFEAKQSPEADQNQIVQQVGERGVVVTARVSKSADKANLSIRDIVRQSAVPVLLQQSDAESPEEAGSPEVPEEEEEQAISSSRRSRRSHTPSASFLSRRQYPHNTPQRAVHVVDTQYIGSQSDSNIDDEVSISEEIDTGSSLNRSKQGVTAGRSLNKSKQGVTAGSSLNRSKQAGINLNRSKQGVNARSNLNRSKLKVTAENNLNRSSQRASISSSRHNKKRDMSAISTSASAAKETDSSQHQTELESRTNLSSKEKMSSISKRGKLLDANNTVQSLAGTTASSETTRNKSKNKEEGSAKRGEDLPSKGSRGRGRRRSLLEHSASEHEALQTSDRGKAGELVAFPPSSAGSNHSTVGARKKLGVETSTQQTSARYSKQSTRSRLRRNKNTSLVAPEHGSLYQQGQSPDKNLSIKQQKAMDSALKRQKSALELSSGAVETKSAARGRPPKRSLLKSSDLGTSSSALPKQTLRGKEKQAPEITSRSGPESSKQQKAMDSVLKQQEAALQMTSGAAVSSKSTARGRPPKRGRLKSNDLSTTPSSLPKQNLGGKQNRTQKITSASETVSSKPKSSQVIGETAAASSEPKEEAGPSGNNQNLGRKQSQKRAAENSDKLASTRSRRGKASALDSSSQQHLSVSSRLRAKSSELGTSSQNRSSASSGVRGREEDLDSCASGPSPIKKTRRNSSQREAGLDAESSGQEEEAAAIPSSTPLIASSKDKAKKRLYKPASRRKLASPPPAAKRPSDKHVSAAESSGASSPRRFFTDPTRTLNRLVSSKVVGVTGRRKGGYTNSFWKTSRRLSEGIQRSSAEQGTSASSLVYDYDSLHEDSDGSAKRQKRKKPRVKSDRQGSNHSEDRERRAKKGRTEMDVVINMLNDTESDFVREQCADNRTSQNFVHKAFTFVKKELKETLSQWEEVKELNAQVNKLKSACKTMSEETQENIQQKHILQKELQSLKSKGIDRDLVAIDSWMHDFDTLCQSLA